MDIGEQVFDALVKTGWQIDVADDGKITATKGGSRIAGQIEASRDISWGNLDIVDKVLHQARILELRERAGQPKASDEI
jgi:hypothetical protein